MPWRASKSCLWRVEVSRSGIGAGFGTWSLVILPHLWSPLRPGRVSARRFFLGGFGCHEPVVQTRTSLVSFVHSAKSLKASQISRPPRVGSANCREWPTSRCLVNNQVITLWGNPIAEGKSAKSGVSQTTRGEPVTRFLGVKQSLRAALPLHTMYVVSFVEDLSFTGEVHRCDSKKPA